MATYSPIQVVLDARQFQADRKRNAGSSNKEFFEGLDAAFAVHKQQLSEQLQAVKSKLQNSSASGIGFLKVQMREDALAKSHRPTKRIFHPNIMPLAGSSGVGELIVQISPSGIDQAIAQVESAENELAYKPKKDKPDVLEPDPSRERAEVGAIESVRLWDGADRRAFNTDQALAWFNEQAVPKAYRVDLFESIQPIAKSARQDLAGYSDVVDDLLRQLDEDLGCGYVGALYRPDTASMMRLYIWLRQEPKHRYFVRAAKLAEALRASGGPSFDKAHHDKLLEVLGQHPAVRRVSLPPALRSGAASAAPTATPSAFTPALPAVGAQYPVVGVIDGGVGPVHSAWVMHHSQVVPTAHADVSHGGEITGLLVSGQALNGNQVSPEPDGCLIADLAMVPRDIHYDANYSSDLAFVLSIEQEVKAAKQQTGARVFCFSHNFEDPPGHSDAYPDLSAGLDRIARAQDVIFVISAGNTKTGTGRQEWHIDPMLVLSNLASVNDDGLTSPADALFAVSVGALNPPAAAAGIAQAPARYSRRGVSTKHFVKPDIAHYGGLCASTSADTGLLSTSSTGSTRYVAGTSYAGPLAAKTLARLDQLTGSKLPREGLTALLIHGARPPACLSTYSKKIARQFVGFGLPSSSDAFLSGAPHQATLLFYDDMQNKKDLFFKFDWPESLVEHGKCKGEALLTMVYSPPIQDAHDGELVRINLEAALHQRKPDLSWEKRSEDTFATEPNKAASAMEKHLIEEGLKWGTVKQVRFFSPNGVGKTSEWRVCIKYLTRASEEFPTEGIPFAAVLTILDPEGGKPVYQDMKIGLSQRNVLTSDVRSTVQTQVQATSGKS
jgi:hypothetical protein